MAVRATAVEITNGIQERRSRWMATGIVTGIAHPWHAHLQQLRITGAMGFVAVDAILHDGRVFPQERTTSFRVATQAILVDGSLPKLRGIRRAVRIVAARARHFAFAVRHVRRPLQLRAPHLMAAQAELWLSFLEAPVL